MCSAALPTSSRLRLSSRDPAQEIADPLVSSGSSTLSVCEITLEGLIRQGSSGYFGQSQRSALVRERVAILRPCRPSALYGVTGFRPTARKAAPAITLDRQAAPECLHRRLDRQLKVDARSHKKTQTAARTTTTTTSAPPTPPRAHRLTPPREDKPYRPTRRRASWSA